MNEILKWLKAVAVVVGGVAVLAAMVAVLGWLGPEIVVGAVFALLVTALLVLLTLKVKTELFP